MKDIEIMNYDETFKELLELIDYKNYDQKTHYIVYPKSGASIEFYNLRTPKNIEFYMSGEDFITLEFNNVCININGRINFRFNTLEDAKLLNLNKWFRDVKDRLQSKEF